MLRVFLDNQVERMSSKIGRDILREHLQHSASFHFDPPKKYHSYCTAFSFAWFKIADINYGPSVWYLRYLNSNTINLIQYSAWTCMCLLPLARPTFFSPHPFYVRKPFNHFNLFFHTYKKNCLNFHSLQFQFRIIKLV